MGLIEFLPLPGGESAGLYNLLFQLSGMGMAIISGHMLDRLPNFFTVKYKTGLIYNGSDEIEKENVKNSIARRAFLKAAKYVDPAFRQASESESIDGVSSSVSRNLKQFFEEVKEDDKRFVENVRKKYAKNANIVIV
jgi:hypothetical protein